VILEKIVARSRKDWANKLDDALWAYFMAFKTPIGTTSYRLVYEKHDIFLLSWSTRFFGPSSF